MSSSSAPYRPPHARRAERPQTEEEILRDAMDRQQVGSLEWKDRVMNLVAFLRKEGRFGEVCDLMEEIFTKMGDPCADKGKWGHDHWRCRHIWVRSLRDKKELVRALEVAEDGATDAAARLKRGPKGGFVEGQHLLACQSMLNLRLELLDRLGRQDEIFDRVMNEQPVVDQCGPVMELDPEQCQCHFQSPALRAQLLEQGGVYGRMFRLISLGHGKLPFLVGKEREEVVKRIETICEEVESIADDADTIIAEGEECRRSGDPQVPISEEVRRKKQQWKRDANWRAAFALRDGGAVQAGIMRRQRAMKFVDNGGLEEAALLRLHAEDLRFLHQELLCKPVRERSPEEEAKLREVTDEAMDFLDQAQAVLEQLKEEPYKKHVHLCFRVPMERATWHAARGEWEPALNQARVAVESRLDEGVGPHCVWEDEGGPSGAQVWESVARLMTLRELERDGESPGERALEKAEHTARDLVRRFEENSPESPTSTDRQRKDHLVRWMRTLLEE